MVGSHPSEGAGAALDGSSSVSIGELWHVIDQLDEVGPGTEVEMFRVHRLPPHLVAVGVLRRVKLHEFWWTMTWLFRPGWDILLLIGNIHPRPVWIIVNGKLYQGSLYVWGSL
jgi:hypothetical protein